MTNILVRPEMPPAQARDSQPARVLPDVLFARPQQWREPESDWAKPSREFIPDFDKQTQFSDIVSQVI